MREKIDCNNEPFAKGLCFSKLVLLFTLGSFLGVVWENSLGVVKRLIKFGTLSYRDHRGVIYGPFNPLYGFGIVIITLILGRKKRPLYNTFIYGALLGGLIEYIASFLLEFLFGAKSWDYTYQMLDINGRTSIGYMIFWGLGMTILIHYAYPIISKWIESIPKKIGNILVKFFVIFLSLDMVISLIALTRYTLRHKKVDAYTIIGRACDKYYPDEFMQKIYVNLKFED